VTFSACYFNTAITWVLCYCECCCICRSLWEANKHHTSRWHDFTRFFTCSI